MTRMKNSILFLILLAAGITYGQIHVEYDAESDQIITSVITEDYSFRWNGVPTNTPAETFTPLRTPETSEVYQFDYYYLSEDFIQKYSYIFNDHGKELFYHKFIRITRWNHYKNKR